MGKKRTIMVDLSQEEDQPTKPKPKKKLKPEVKPAKEDEAKEKAEEVAVEEEAPAKPKEPRIRSQRFQKLHRQVDPQKQYPLEEALDLLLKLANAGFDESVELNLTTKKEGVSGSVKLPHGTGKEKKIAIWDAKVEAKVKKGQLDFDILIAKPADMGKIAKYGKTLGPKGLMPNPKTGTISENPEEAAKKLKQAVSYKTEKAAPLIHAAVGKTSLGKKKLTENIRAFIEAVGPKQILKASIASSMGPGIKLQLE